MHLLRAFPSPVLFLCFTEDCHNRSPFIPYFIYALPNTQGTSGLGTDTWSAALTHDLSKTYWISHAEDKALLKFLFVHPPKKQQHVFMLLNTDFVI